MKPISTIGRILFALPFAIFGLNHFFMFNFYFGMLTSFIPVGGFIIILTGIMLIIASVSIITKWYTYIATISLAILLFLFIVTIHIPQLFDHEKSMIALISMLKDISLMGGSLLIAGLSKENKLK